MELIDPFLTPESGPAAVEIGPRRHSAVNCRPARAHVT